MSSPISLQRLVLYSRKEEVASVLGSYVLIGVVGEVQPTRIHGSVARAILTGISVFGYRLRHSNK